MIPAQLSQTSSAFSVFTFMPAFLGLIIGLAVFVFWLRMIIECATRESSEGNTKIIWMLVILLTSWLGALIYYFIRRPQRIQEAGR
jgi:nitrate reductase gamma subunit